jgi:hypothetical protein
MAALAPSKEEFLSSDALRWLKIISPTLTELGSFDEEAIKKQILKSFKFFSSHPPIADGEVWERHIEQEFVAVAQRWETSASGWGEERNLILHAKAQAWHKLRMLRTSLDQLPYYDIRVICELRGQVEPPPTRSNFTPEQLPQYMECLAAHFGSLAISAAQQSNRMLGINSSRPADLRAAISDDGMIDGSSIRANARERTRREEEVIPSQSGDTRPASPILYDPTEADPAIGYVGMMDKLTEGPPVRDTGHHDGAGRQREFRWQAPKIIELADYRETSDVVVLGGVQSSNSEALKVAERVASGAASGDVLWFPTGDRVPATQLGGGGRLPDPDSESEGGIGDPAIAPAARCPVQAPRPGPVLISPTDADIFFSSPNDRASRKAELAVAQERAAHGAKPDRPAWQNLLNTEEGAQKGESWAKDAIWRELSGQDKIVFKKVENVSSYKFLDLCSGRGVQTLMASKIESWGNAKDRSSIDKQVKRYFYFKRCIEVGRKTFPNGYPASLDDDDRAVLANALFENELPGEDAGNFISRLRKTLKRLVPSGMR